MSRLGECSSGICEIGGKAFHLNRLHERFPVPTGFVITESASTQTLHQLLRELKTPSVAVRSSAVDEDGSSYSFAGMHTTLLHVPCNYSAVQRAIEECKQSVHSDRATKYRAQTQKTSHYLDEIDLTIPIMPIMIQEMIAPLGSGVCFTQHPITKKRNEILLEFVPGLGESLVSGHVTPEQHVYSVSKNQVVLLRKEHGDRMGEEILTDAVALQVVQLCLEVEKASDNIPQDIEFAYDGKQVWLLQAMPITTICPTNQLETSDLLSNRTTREVIPHPMTYMSWSAFFEVIQQGLQIRYQKRKMNYTAICGRPDRGFYELRRGFLYQNLTVLDLLSREEFGAGYEETLMRSFSEVPPELFHSLCSKSRISFTKQISGGLGLINYLRKVTDTIERTQYLLDLHRARFPVFLPKRHFDSWCLDALYGEFSSIQEDFIEFGGCYIEAQIYLELLSSIVQGLLEPRNDKKGTSETFNMLLIGLGDVISHKMNLELAEVITSARNDQVVLSYLEQQSPKAHHQRWHNWNEALDGTETQDLLVRFLRNYGHRAICELEVSSPRWGNDPSYIFELMRLPPNCGSNIDIEESKAKREATENEILQACSFATRPIMRWAVSKLQEFIRFRENLKDIVVRFIARQQQILLAIATQWKEQSILSTLEDIYHISLTHMREFAAGTLLVQDVQALSSRNKELYEEFSSVSIPPKIFCGNKAEVALSGAPGVQMDEGTTKYYGNAGAPGTAIGTAVVIHSLSEIQFLSNCQAESKVLVCSITDPAWTPLFLQVSAVVVETGGVLSHSAIVAREFGIPCVFAIPDLLTMIRSGDILQVNGSEGSVTVHHEETLK